MRLPLTFSFLFLVFSELTPATELFEINTSVRALGMGNAYVGVVQDADALFYNPAGIAQISGFNWLIADPYFGLNGTEVLETVNDVQGSETFKDTVNSLYGDHVWVGGGAKSAFSMPYFAAAIYDHLDASLNMNNPVYPNLDVSVVNDFGYTMGTGFPIIPPVMYLGVGIKYIQRMGARMPFGPTFIGSLDPAAIEEQVQNKGAGYGLDLGLNLRIPGPISPTVSFVWKDIGTTNFKTDSLTLAAPPDIQDEMIVGFALNIDAALVSVTPAFDFKYLNRKDVQLGRKIHFGLEIGLPMIDIRGGFSEGYYTAGAGVHLGIIRVDAATYGVELGEYPGQLEDRRYILQATLELGFDPSNGFFGGGSGGSSRKGSGGSGGGGRGGGGRGLKQRR